MVLFTLIVAGSSVLVPPAQAGVYVVAGCRHADGSPAPMDGWTDDVFAPPAASVSRTCAQGGTTTASFLGSGAASHGGVPYGFSFRTGNPKLVLRGATVWSWSILPNAGPGATWQSYIQAGDTTLGEGFNERAASGPSTVGEPGTPLAASNRVDIPANHFGAASDGIALRLICAASGSSCPGDASIALTRSAVTIQDNAAPQLAAPGAIAEQVSSGAPRSGTVQIAVTATDEGSGLYRALLVVDGKELAPTPFGGNAGRCMPVAGTDRSFEWRQPCLGAGTMQLSWDTASIVDGSHTVEVIVEDASGTRVSSGATAVTTRNHTTIDAGSPAEIRGAANGANGDDAALISVTWPGTARKPSVHASDRRRCAASAEYRSRHAVLCDGQPASEVLTGLFDAAKNDIVEGHLTTATGAPVAQASVEAFVRARVADAADVPLAKSTTGADGSFSFSVPRSDGSLEVVVRYRARANDTVPAAEAKISRTVQATTTLEAPTRVKRDARITFHGVLAGHAGNAEGVPVTLQVRSGSRWLTFGSAQAGSNGAWSRRIRFAHSAGRYPVRIRVGTSVSYPYARGLSRVLTVSVG